MIIFPYSGISIMKYKINIRFTHLEMNYPFVENLKG